MRFVFENIDFTIVGHMRSLLESEGIPCEIRNAGGAGLAGEVPYTQVFPELWVFDPADETRAREIIRAYRAKDAEAHPAPAWACPNCGETVDGNYAECWNCGTPAPTDPAPASPHPVPLQPILSPVFPQDRLPLLDTLRGLALFGILVVNMWGFKSPTLSYHVTENYIPGPMNSIAEEGIRLLAGGKFVSMFAFLFGLGLVLQQDRCSATGAAFTPFLVRRMSLLLVIGILHGMFLWPGDILATYAVFGFLSIWLLRLGPRTLCHLAALIVLIQLVISAKLCAPPSEWVNTGWREATTQWIDGYRTAGFLEMVQMRIYEWFYLSYSALFYQTPYALIFFLLGIASGKTGILSKLDTALPRATKHLAWMIPCGIAISLLFPAVYRGFLPWFFGAELAMSVSLNLGSILLAFAWLVGAAAIFHRGWLPALASVLADAGRMSLTNYLLQSVFANIVFMGWGFGFYGRTSVVQGIVIACLIFVLQLFFSRWWMRRHKTGPVEAALRNAVYPSA